MAGHQNEMHEERLKLCRRAVEHARLGTSDLAPGIMFNEVAAYTDPARFELEMEKLFRGMPQVVCLSRDLPEAGSFRLFDEVGVPIFVTRGQDGGVKAFLNICPHRGARLISQQEGRKPRITCRFHGWSFDGNGRATIPQGELFCGASAAQTSLTEFPAEERHGLIWVLPSLNGKLDLDAHLGDYGRELDKLDLDTFERATGEVLNVTANWKYTFDTYFENYHFPVLHRDTVAPLFGNDIMLYDTWGPHHRVVFPPKEVHKWANQPESEWKVDTIGSPYFIFPNTVLYVGSLSPDELYVNFMRIYPTDVGNFISLVDTYVPSAEKSKTVIENAKAAHAAIISLLVDEDYNVTAEGWKHLLAKPEGSTMIYGRQEVAVQHVHQEYCKALGLQQPEVVVEQEGGEQKSGAA